jgi:integrase
MSTNIKNFLSKMKILFTTRKYPEKSALRVRVTIDSKGSNDISTEIYFTNIDQWNGKKQQFENNDLFNELIARERNKIENIFLGLSKPDAKSVIDIYQGKASPKKIERSNAEKIKRAYKEIDKTLSEEDMKALENKDFGKLQPFADIFILLAKTGINYSHYLEIKDWKDVIEMKEGRYFFIDFRTKNGNHILVLIPHKVIEILEKYKWNPPDYCRDHFNRQLKIIGKELGFNSSFSTKYARKTLANYLLDNGASMETTAKALGHKGLEMVLKHYAKVSPKKVVNEIGHLFNKQ